MDFRRFFLKLTLNIFPPLFFNRIYLKKISPDYKQMEVILKNPFQISIITKVFLVVVSFLRVIPFSQ